MSRNIKEIIQKMTLEEKAGMCSGKDFWHLKYVERLGIPSVMVSDGPHGLRKQDEQADHLGINESIQAVCFPSACATACSFDRDLLKELGTAIGNECQAEDLSTILGPAVNIKRSPLCGRNFEYFSEDPYLAGQMAKSHIEGVQSQGVGTSIKHFAANNQEYRRMTGSSEVDEQTLREIYLAAFETPIKEAHPKTVMCSYNKINGIYSSENPWLLTEVLREEWGFEGYVMSDWGAVDRRVEGLKAGLELEMPSTNGINDKEIIKAVENGTLDEAVLDQAVERVLNVIYDYVDHRKETVWDKEKDHNLAAKIEEESAVLLKNEGILPLNRNGKTAFIGLFAKKPRYQGGGSSHINAFKVSDAVSAASDFADIVYAQGYMTVEDKVDEVLLREAVEAAEQAETAVIFAGLPDSFESEGYDRQHMRLPDCQNHLIQEICQVQPNTVVVLHNGSPVEMPWADEVKGILEMYLGGQAVGEAAVKLLYGDANPCGRLAETVPYQLSDNPSYLNFPGDGEKVEYKEGIFVGYRYYDKKNMEVRYPFGHGLSYTSFEYSDLKLSKECMKDTDCLTISVKVKNTGNRAGKEVVQLYVSNQTGTSNRPIRELKNFEKIYLNPGEEKTVIMELNKRSFAEYNVDLHDWYVPSGKYEVQIGHSSRDIRLSAVVELISTVALPVKVHRNTVAGDLIRNPKTAPVISGLVKRMRSRFGKTEESEDEALSDEMEMHVLDGMPLRELTKMTGMDDGQLGEFIQVLNHAANQ
ncbi:glycoside hydrolase family 3 C-terminal domain-containing protein [Faecalicatena sp. AGMB00832]|uniref:Glycoside hydrolase family 3 C-terminal domain-containing protein n=1 Tax=Faecalicatena faecalis TaxID=2726362 RepID=A0ABS6D2G8_9FIRM|nr:glycoside hydrolase family 3 C-terminal domain-containing protein [Faecalicatena faecalis]MBU3875788.1 glycoside hydrolase family 3 C-terminal domain-containing protein [Faecalicatena faecalis]